VNVSVHDQQELAMFVSNSWPPTHAAYQAVRGGCTEAVDVLFSSRHSILYGFDNEALRATGVLNGVSS
jgi:hypothetical protein